MILLTRPDSTDTAKCLAEKGLKTLVDPMLIIEPLPDTCATGKLQAVLFTSLNGVRFAPDNINQNCELAMTVGDATAEAAQRKFKKVRNAHGNVDDLFNLCVSSLDPAKGPLIHYAGDVTRGNLVERLLEKGFQAEERIVYKAIAKDELSMETQINLSSGGITSALFFSPRTAKVFMQNLARHGLQEYTHKVTAYCLSEAVAAELRHGSWENIVVPAKPTQDCLLELIQPEGN